MTASAIVALRKAVHAKLAGDAALSGLLGGARVYDEAPRAAEPPYLTFGDLRSRDWSTQSGHGGEHFLVVDVWSQQRGQREALAVAARVQDLLDDAALSLEGHALVNFRYQQLETRRENQGRYTRASLRFRAVTETP